jgi:hypothetical protein
MFPFIAISDAMYCIGLSLYIYIYIYIERERGRGYAPCVVIQGMEILTVIGGLCCVG